MKKDSRKGLFAGFLLAAIRVTPPDGFARVIPRADRSRWPPLLATRRAGRPRHVRDKGTLRRIYPHDMDSALQDTVYRLRRVRPVRAKESADGGRP